MSQENKQVEPIKEYYIAYFDLLGYKNFFQSYPDEVNNFLEAIHEAISNTKEYIQNINSSSVAELGNLSIRTKVFSDNILLCMEIFSDNIEYPRFLAFLTIIADIQRNFILKYGLFLRGGITIGELSFNEDFVFGQGLIDAVALEEAAMYPRIIMGQAVRDYVQQPHFVGSEDLSRACDIERREHSGDCISDEELIFYSAIIPNVNMEKIYLQWRNDLLLPVADGEYVLNYLYCLNTIQMLNPATMEQMKNLLEKLFPNEYQKLYNHSSDQRQWLEQHQTRIIQKINEFGKYDDLDISEEKEAHIREHILKKYLWVLTFHNYVCAVYGIPDCMVKSGSACDIRFMRMTVKIFEDSSSTEKQQEINQEV